MSWSSTYIIVKRNWAGEYYYLYKKWFRMIWKTNFHGSIGTDKNLVIKTRHMMFFNPAVSHDKHEMYTKRNESF